MDRNDGSEREVRDAAGVGPYARERESLVPLSSLSSWTVSEGEPDVRGWEIRTVSGRQLGTVKDLLVDAQAGEVVLLDVDLAASDRHTFVPIRVAQIDRVRRIVLMDSADFPDTSVGHDDASVVRTTTGPDRGTVRYPRTDREVNVERTRFVGDAPPSDDRSASGRDDAESERRRAERRRIDRLSTDL